MGWYSTTVSFLNDEIESLMGGGGESLQKSEKLSSVI